MGGFLFFFPNNQMGIRKQETERRNVKVMAQVEDGWMFTGQKRNNFGVSSQNSEDGNI